MYVFLGAAVGVAIALLIPNQYVSTATFIAQGSTSSGIPAALQGAVASLGLDRGSDYSPKFYADLLSSRPVLVSAIRHQYHVPRRGQLRKETYLQIAGLEEGSPPVMLEAAIRHLARRVAAKADVRTNMVTLSVRSRFPTVSRDIAEQLLIALDSLNVGFRQHQSRDSREFYETRVLQSRGELDSAERTVEKFLQQNRVVSSPALQFEFQRLQREAELKRNVYAIVVQQYEHARLQEARNVPTLTVLAEPFVPVKKSSPPRRLIVAIGAIMGLIVLWTKAVVGEALARFRKEEPESWQLLATQVPFARYFVRGQ